MTAEIISAWAVILVLVLSGQIFIASVIRTLRERSRKEELRRYVSALERLDNDLERYRGTSPEPPAAPRKQGANEVAGLQPGTDIWERWGAPFQGPEAMAEDVKVMRLQQRQDLLNRWIINADEGERRFLSETSLEPQTEESILAFLRKAREFRERREEEEAVEDRRERAGAR